jgi:hypothetical protein
MRLSTFPRRTGLASVAPVIAQDRAIDAQRSTIATHVGKSGFLSAAAQDHTIDAPISSSLSREFPSPQIEFTVESAKMMVRSDKKQPRPRRTVIMSIHLRGK